MGLLDESIGSAFVGCLLTAIFYGVTCLQAVKYFTSGPPDGRFVKSLVLAILLLDTLHMALVSHFVYTLIVKDFGNLLSIHLAPWSLGSSFLVSLVSDTVVRLFFARKVWCLSGKNVPLMLLLSIPISLAFGVTLASTINVIIVSLNESSPTQWLLDFSLIASMVADFFLAVTLTYLFYTSKSDYFESTNNMLNTLCKYTINTGLIAAIWTICCIVSNTMAPDLYVVLIFYLPLSKVYTNAILGSLNVRESLRGMSETKFLAPKPYKDSKFVDLPLPPGRQNIDGGKGISIRIDSETEFSESPYSLNRLESRPVALKSISPRPDKTVLSDSRLSRAN
ncbi:hypothetical protein SCHPADRAFT_992673, partial [Schizopora paradoxa]